VKREIEDNPPRLFAFEGPPPVQTVRVVVKIGQGLLAVKEEGQGVSVRPV
jgi:hypothetical protein